MIAVNKIVIKYRVSDNCARTKHSQEIMFLNAHISKPMTGDMFLDAHGVSMERLDEATKAIAKLSECKEKMMFK